MLQEQGRQRERDIESLRLARENRKKERALRRAQEHELQKAMKQNAQQSIREITAYKAGTARYENAHGTLTLLLDLHSVRR